MSGAELLARGGELRFAHAVNSLDRLDEQLAGPCNTIEGDVNWGWQFGGGLWRTAIMAHPPRRVSDLAFEAWLERALDAGRVIKIDLKDERANRTIVSALDQPHVPFDRVFVNADMVRGPSGDDPDFSVALGQQWRARFAELVVSVGCTTGPDRLPYTAEHLSALLDAAATIGEPVTVCLDVHRVDSDPSALERVKDAGRHVSLWNRYPCDLEIYRRYRQLVPDGFIDLFDADRNPIVE